MLCDLFRQADPRTLAQVDGGSGYDHKHQPAIGALTTMCAQIAATLFAELKAEGVETSGTFRSSLSGAYHREATQAVRRFAHLAQINGLPFDCASESELVSAFALSLAQADSTAIPKLPPWTRWERKATDLVQGLESLVWEG
jgi:glucosyl-3-phosphoglycerate synthase